MSVSTTAKWRIYALLSTHESDQEVYEGNMRANLLVTMKNTENTDERTWRVEER